MDQVFNAWLQKQHLDLHALNAASDVVRVEAVAQEDALPRAFLAQFRAPTLVRDAHRQEAQVQRVESFTVLVRFADTHLVHAPDPAQTVNVLEPGHLFHPNAMPFLFLCIGRIAPGTELVPLLQRAYEILVFQRMTLAEHDALNHQACAWARQHLRSLPLSNAPLQRPAVVPPFVVPEVQP